LKKKKLLIIGLDGGTYTFMDPLIKEGKLPNIEKLINGGVKAVLRSTIPPITSPAWVTFMTGKNPGKHGFFDFFKYDIKNPDYYFAPAPQDALKKFVKNFMNSHNYAGQTIFDFLGQSGYKVASIFMPMTYPPWPINGYMVSGYPVLDFDKPTTYPEQWSKELGPIFDNSALLTRNKEKLIKECKRLVEKTTDITLKQLSKNECDVLALVYSSIDFSQHRLWLDSKEDASPYKNVISEMYAQVDKDIGRITSQVGEDTSIVILSDHGFCACPEKAFSLNAWLAQEKYLTPQKKNILANLNDRILNYLRHNKITTIVAARRILSKLPLFFRQKASSAYYKGAQIDWTKTKACRYKMGPCEGIVINKIGRQKVGIVAEGTEYNDLRDEIISKLETLKDPQNGQKIVREIYRREDLYNGNFVEEVPDIVIVLNSSYMGGLEVDGPIVQPVTDEFRDVYSGQHDLDGILILKGTKFKEKDDIGTVNMVDVAPTLLFDLDLPISTDIDGKVIYSAFKEQFASRQAKLGNISEKQFEEQEFSDQEKEKIEKSLRSLGYLE